MEGDKIGSIDVVCKAVNGVLKRVVLQQPNTDRLVISFDTESEEDLAVFVVGKKYKLEIREGE